MAVPVCQIFAHNATGMEAKKVTVYVTFAERIATSGANATNTYKTTVFLSVSASAVSKQ